MNVFFGIPQYIVEMNMKTVANKLMAVTLMVIKWDRLKRYVHTHIDACKEICMHVYFTSPLFLW